MLKTGVAYHGNRILKHVESDLTDIIRSNFNLVVHMFSHTDWDRHHEVMKDIFSMTKDKGLDLWVDNWGLGGPPGDKSHFLAYHPNAHQVYSDGSFDPVRACYNHDSFRRFTYEWIDMVKACGASKIFWDEPHLVAKNNDGQQPTMWTCRCSVCQKKFSEKYGIPMPVTFTSEVEEFRLHSIVDYFTHVTQYSKKRDMQNIVCVMLSDRIGINLSNVDTLGNMDTLDNIGSDPYWIGKKGQSAYEYVYRGTKKNLEICEKYKKEHNIWIQGFGIPAGREEEIIDATAAAYDAGARTILFWSYRGAESNTYRSKHTELVWKTAADAFFRIATEDRSQRIEKMRSLITCED